MGLFHSVFCLTHVDDAWRVSCTIPVNYSFINSQFGYGCLYSFNRGQKVSVISALHMQLLHEG